MKITQAEIIQLLRRRTHMNQGHFGARAFSTSYESGRTKIKNIELGKQKPTNNDLVKMARVLGVAPETLMPDAIAPAGGDGMVVPRRVLEAIPGLETYLEMLINAVKLEDRELMTYLAGKLGELFTTAATHFMRNEDPLPQAGAQ